LNRRSSSSPIDVHTQGGTSKYIMNMYQTPVESFRSHLIPLALARAIHFIFKH
jgi:hypothetical protein